MGLSNFFDNFLGGMAFGMIAGNPFFGGCGSYGGGYNTNIVDFGTFANGFPKIFNDSITTSAMSQPSIFTTFANPFPTAPDFSNVAKTIWDSVTDSNSYVNKQIAEYYKRIDESIPQSKNVSSIPKIDMPFSPYYLPMQTGLPQFYPNLSVWDYFRYPMQTVQNNKTETVEPLKQNNSSKIEQESAKKQSNTSLSTQKTETMQSNTSLSTPKTEKEQNKAQISYNYSAEALKERWKSKTGSFPDKFFTRVIDISRTINCRPDDLMAIMNFESKGFKLNAVNPISGATGLIQFTKTTAEDLGTSTKTLARMSSLEQLYYVEKYLKSRKTAAGYPNDYVLNLGELYAIIFRPKYARSNYLAKQGEKAYQDNKGLDKNKDGYITKAEVTSKLREFMA